MSLQNPNIDIPAPKTWANLPKSQPCSFRDLMTNDLVEQLTNEEDDQIEVQNPTSQDLTFTDSSNTDTNSDELLAKLLQKQFDDEQNDFISRWDSHYNGQSKVTLSHDKYKVKIQESSDSSDELEDFPLWMDREKKDPKHQFSKCGVSGKGVNMISKHDPDLCAIKNAVKLDKFAPEIGVGDHRGLSGIKLPNQVFNSLKEHSINVSKRQNRVHEKKEHSTAVMAVDEKTRLILFKLVNAEWIEELHGVISTGKESVVMAATGGRKEGTIIPKHCAIKIFKTTLTDFKNRAIYVNGDVRYFKDNLKKQNPRILLKIWAEKETSNLKRLTAHNIPCPKVITLKKHVLVMSLIGKDDVAAPSLKEADLNEVQLENAWHQTRKHMIVMFQNCHLVHADLSPFNLLWSDEMVYIIDVGQAVETQHPLAYQFLLRDCQIITKFFNVLPNIPSPYELFNEITGLNLKGEGKEFLLQIQEYDKNEENIRMNMTDKTFAFDYFFDKSKKSEKNNCDDEDNHNN